MKPFIVIIISLVVVAGAVTFVLTSPDDTVEQNTNDTALTTQSDEAAESVTITYDDSGFSPQSYKLKVGGTVTVQNNSNQVLDFASDDHPAHTDNSELNAGEIPADSSQSFTLYETGTWGFHNHFRDAHAGSITVL